MPKGIRQIGEEAFASQIFSLVGLQNIVSIDHGAFKGCQSLMRLDRLNSLTTIGEQTFQECEILIKLEGLNKLTTIGELHFRVVVG